MSGFGERLKRERESRDTPLEDVARRTRIGIRYLEALERGDFDGLPGRRGFGKLYIRIYAELFGFDPEPVISEYDQERLEREVPSGTASPIVPERPRKVRFVPRARRSSSTERRTQPPAPPVEDSAPDPATAPIRATEPVEPPMDSRDAGNVESAEAVTRPSTSTASSEPGPVPDLGPKEPSVTSGAPAKAAMTEGAPSWKRRIAVGAVAVVVLGAFGVLLKMRTSRPADTPVLELLAATGTVSPPAGSNPERDDTRVGQDATGAPPVPVPSTPSQVTPISHDPPPVSSAPAAGPRPADSRPLEIHEFELGTNVIDHRVVDVRREFEEGTVASFLTRVLGGAPGRTIHHAWIREGHLVQTIEVRVGSPDWRTYSRKTLWGTGDWAVEAHDENGGVLARIEFRCLPKSGP